MTQTPTAEAPFELKGSLFTLTVLHLRETDLGAIEQALLVKIAQAPAFFANTPVVVDLDALADTAAMPDFAGLALTLRTRGLVPVGVRHGSAAQLAAAAAAGLPMLPESRPALRREASTDAGGDAKPADPGPHNRVVVQPVRSGQQVYAADGDLTLLGPVSAGAEVLADGSIHVYGPLRGRALAGVRGNLEARIFCLGLEAELVSVAGRYRILEKNGEGWGKAVQIYLSGEHLIIEPLTVEAGAHRKS